MPPTQTPVFHQHRYAEELDRFVTEGCAWLEIGAGHKIHDGWLGVSQDDLASRPSFFAGVDLDDSIFKNPHLHEAKLADAANLPWDDATFDIASANMVVEHLADPVAALKEVWRVLRPQGVFVFVTTNLNHPLVRMASILVPSGLRRSYRVLVERADPADVFPTTYRCNTIKKVRSLAAETGFEVELSEVFLTTRPILPGFIGQLELRLGVKAAKRKSSRNLGSNLIVVLRKPGN